MKHYLYIYSSSLYDKHYLTTIHTLIMWTQNTTKVYINTSYK